MTGALFFMYLTVKKPPKYKNPYIFPTFRQLFKKKLRGFNPLAKYADRAIAAGQRS
jgi:hypothetical protein